MLEHHRLPILEFAHLLLTQTQLVLKVNKLTALLNHPSHLLYLGLGQLVNLVLGRFPLSTLAC